MLIHISRQDGELQKILKHTKQFNFRKIRTLFKSDNYCK